MEELFLIYAFIEQSYAFFSEKTQDHDKRLLFFDHLSSLLKVTMINIQSYLRDYIGKLQESLFQSDQFNSVFSILLKDFGMVKYVSPDLSKRV